jgi:dihydrofolate reductase
VIISLIVAASENDVIGRDGALPWRLPKDARRFRALTTGHVVVMGRVTHDSIVAALGRPLPDRASIVVTRSARPPGSVVAQPPGSAGARPADAADGAETAGRAGAGGEQVLWAASVDAALGLAERIAAGAGDTELFVVGGVSIYRDTLPRADRIYLTRVHHEVAGDRSMPPGWLDGFDLVRSEEVSDDKTHLSYSFLDYERARR